MSGGTIGARLVLVVGARRSGTNWVGRMIGAHPDVTALPNETYLFHALEQLGARFQHGSSGSWQLATLYVERPRFVAGLSQLCDAVLGPHLDGTRAGQRLLERTPDHVRNLGLVGEIYPDARVVHIVRDGRDVARSLVSMPWGPDDLGEAATEWASAVEAGRAAGGGLRHYHEVRYEELLADPKVGVAALYEVLDLDAGDAVVESALLEAGVPYNHDPSMPTIGAEKWRTALDADQVTTIEAVAGNTLRAAGYELSAGSGARPVPRGAGSRRVGTWAVRHLREWWRTARPAGGGTGDLQAAQQVVDAFLVAIARRDRAAALDLLDERAQVRTICGLDRWEGRGPDASERFLDQLLEDGVLGGPPAMSDVHPSPVAFTVVAVGEVDGRVRHRTLVLYLRLGRITRATWSTDS